MDSRRVPVLLFTLIGAFACGGDDDDVRVPFGPPSATTTFEFQGAMPFIQTDRYVVANLGDKTIAGTTLRRYKVGYDVPAGALPDETTRGAEFWIGRPSADAVVVGGFEEVSGITVVVDPPVTVPLNPPVGETQTVTLTGTTTNPGGTPQAATVTVTASLVDGNATVATKLGTVTGVRHYSGTLLLSGPGVPPYLLDFPVAGEIWHHPDLGLVAGRLPDLGIDLGVSSEQDWGDATSGFNTIRKVGVVGPQAPDFLLDTYDRAGAFDADKDTHAKMLVELRWAAESDALTLGRPDPLLCVVEFGTVWGRFDSALVESPFSIFHPEENGKGYRYWYALVDQAARNESVNGIAYHVGVRTDPMLPPLRVTARIRYNLYP